MLSQTTVTDDLRDEHFVLVYRNMWRKKTNTENDNIFEWGDTCFFRVTKIYDPVAYKYR